MMHRLCIFLSCTTMLQVQVILVNTFIHDVYFASSFSTLPNFTKTRRLHVNMNHKWQKTFQSFPFLQTLSASSAEILDAGEGEDKAGLVEELNKLTKEFIDIQATIQKNTQLYEEQLQKYEEEVKSLTSEIQKLTLTIDEQKVEIQSLLEQQQDDKSEEDDQNMVIVENKKQWEEDKLALETKFTKEIQVKQEEMQKIQIQLQELQNENQTQKEQLSTIESKTQSLTKEKVDAVENKVILESKLKEANMKIAESNLATQSQHSQIQKLQKELNDQKRKAAVAENPMTKEEAQIQFTKDIISVKSQSRKDLYEMEKKMKTLEYEANKRVQELEVTLASYEKERGSLRKLTILGLNRIRSIITLKKLREKLQKD